jgi:hypothetical protein
MSKSKQAEMFDAGEDLPLFSGTAPRAGQSVYHQDEQVHQAGLFSCSICRDTGILPGHSESRRKICLCEAGFRQAIIGWCADLSDADITYLSGEREASKIEHVRSGLVEWVSTHPLYDTVFSAYDAWTDNGREKPWNT